MRTAPRPLPVIHVSWHEADAFARWAGKRLPTEHEWEAARPSLEDVGQVWEWTSSDFLAYPGFEAFPYREYSELFFGDEYKVLRGGSWATHPDVVRPSFRNWDLPRAPPDLRRHPLREGCVMTTTEPQIEIEVHLTAGGGATMAREVRLGLLMDPKELAPKYFYDERGSQLFERITELPEYYPTRAEREILADRSAEIVAAAGEPGTLVELGSGSAAKTRHLLSAMRDAGCLRHLRPGRHLRGDHPRDGASAWSRSTRASRSAASSATSSTTWSGSRTGEGGGSSPSSAARSATSTRTPVASSSPGWRRCSAPRTGSCSAPTWSRSRPASRPPTTTRRGSPPSSTRTCCEVLNRELGADFDLDAFEHVARYDGEEARMDIRLRSLADQSVRLDGLDLTVSFAAGEEMRTEISSKFTRDRLESIYAEAGLELSGWFTDQAGDYALSLAKGVD